MSLRRSLQRAILAASLLLLVSGSARAAQPFAQASPADRALIAAARAAVESRCDCAAAGRHAAYMRCVVQAAKLQVVTERLSKKQLHEVMRCAARSTCGRAGAVTCCRTNRRGRTRCAVMPAAKCRPV
jgi:hypothetical protein